MITGSSWLIPGVESNHKCVRLVNACSFSLVHNFSARAFFYTFINKILLLPKIGTVFINKSEGGQVAFNTLQPSIILILVIFKKLPYDKYCSSIQDKKDIDHRR